MSIEKVLTDLIKLLPTNQHRYWAAAATIIIIISISVFRAFQKSDPSHVINSTIEKNEGVVKNIITERVHVFPNVPPEDKKRNVDCLKSREMELFSISLTSAHAKLLNLNDNLDSQREQWDKRAQIIQNLPTIGCSPLVMDLIDRSILAAKDVQKQLASMKTPVTSRDIEKVLKKATEFTDNLSLIEEELVNDL